MLFPYQTTAVNDTRAAFANHKRIILTMPTGSGKTYTAATMVKAAINKGRRVKWVAHRTELLDQAEEAFANISIINPRQYITSIQKWNFSPWATPPDFIVIDEAHLSMAESYKKLAAMYPRAYILGLTATPYRLDGQGLGEIYTEIIRGPETQHLIDIGRLARPLYRVPANIDFSQFNKAGNDFDPRQMAAFWNKAKVFAGVVKNFTQICPTAKAIAFSANVEQSQKLAEEFTKAGYIAAHVDADTTEKERRRLLGLFRLGHIQILCNVALFTEGYDLPNIDAVILNRATLSRALYMQMVGRAGRIAQGKTHFYVLDFGGNVFRHGLWESPVDFTLDGTPPSPKQGIAPMKVCKACFTIMAIQSKVCPTCGKDQTPAAREQEETELIPLEQLPQVSEIAELTNAATQRMRPEAAAHRLAAITASPLEYRRALSELATLRGYSPGWVYRTLKNVKWKGNNAAQQINP
jgi:DNA repair protein RadD